jgi:hypothetical protein
VAIFRDGSNELKICAADFDVVHLVSLTLEQLGHIVNNAGALIHAGQRRAPWTVSIDDLEVITEILTRPAAFVHFISRREVYLPHSNIQNGDELGFLEGYLKTSLREEPDTFAQYDAVQMDPSSTTIDAYENAKGAGEAASPPEQQIPQEVAALLDALANERPGGWLAASMLLLNLIPRHQRVLARAVNKFASDGRVPGVSAKGEDGTTVACLRLDDPRLSGINGEGIVLRVDRDLHILDLNFAYLYADSPR